MTAHDARPVCYIDRFTLAELAEGSGSIVTEISSAPWGSNNCALYTATDYDALRAEVERLREECSERQRLLAKQAQNVLEQVAYGTQQFMRAEAAEASIEQARGSLKFALDDRVNGQITYAGVSAIQNALAALNYQGQDNG